MLSIRTTGFIFVTLVLVRAILMGALPLIDTSEPRYAEIARVMAETGDWITPWFEPGMPFWGKPPLTFWLSAFTFKIFGINEFAARLPSLGAYVLTACLVHRLAKALYGNDVARWASLIFASMTLPLTVAGAVLTDPLLLLAITLSVTSFYLAPSGWGQWGFGFFAGLIVGMLAKGPLAWVFIGAVVITWSFFGSKSERANWSALPWFSGLALTACLAAPWFILAEIKTPGFLEYFIVGEHIKRFTEPGWAGDLFGTAHRRPYGAIWLYGIVAALPWSFVALVVVIRCRSQWSAGRLLSCWKDSRSRLLLVWTLVPLVFFTFSGNILWTYALPALPPFAIAVATYVVRAQSLKTRSLLLLTVLIVPLFGIAFAAFGLADTKRLKSEKWLVKKATDQMGSGDRLAYLDSLPFSARFYSEGKAELVSRSHLQSLLREVDQAVYLAVPKAELPMIKKSLTAYQVLDESKEWVLIRLAGDRNKPVVLEPKQYAQR